jgi:SRSO17 transposase
MKSNDPAYAERRAACGVPSDLSFRTKNQLAGEMIEVVRQARDLRCRWVACDEAFGRDTGLLDQIAQTGLWYFAEVPKDTQVWRTRPATAVPAWKGQGRKPTRPQLVAGSPNPETVTAMAARLPASVWSCSLIQEGSQGPQWAEFARLRVTAVREGLPGPVVWLVLRRSLTDGEIKFFLCNAPVKVAFSRLARVSGLRWPIETCFETGKQLLGMGDYEVRSWLGWHHHMTLVILALTFLVRVQRHLKTDAPALTLPQVVLFLSAALPQPQLDSATVFAVLAYHQQRNWVAYRSHRQRRLARLRLAA